MNSALGALMDVCSYTQQQQANWTLLQPTTAGWFDSSLYQATASQTLATTTTYTPSLTVWYKWTTDSTACDQQTVWYEWSSQRRRDDFERLYAQTQEEIATAQAQAQREAVQRIERLEQENAQLKEAKERAEALLIATLDDQQKAEYQKERSFTVISKDGQRKYRIRSGRSRNVDLINDKGERIKTYCAHPADAVPDQDTMLAQKLMIEHAEEEFLRVANAS